MAESRKTLYWLFAYVLLVIAAFYFRESLGRLNDMISIITPAITVYFGYKAYKFFGSKSLQGKSILLITICMGLFLFGDFYWILHDKEVISIADLLWLLGYPFFIVGIYLGVIIIDPDFFKQRKNMLVTGLLLIVAAMYLKFFPLSWNSEAGFLENLVTYGYVIADVMLLFFTLLVVYVSYLIRSGKYFKFWVAVGIGNILFLVADSLYAINYATYISGDFVDMIWILGYIAYAIGFIILVDNASNAIETANSLIKTKLKRK